MEPRPPATVMIDVTPPILSDVLVRELRALEVGLQVWVGRDSVSREAAYDIAIVSGSAQGVSATLLLCLPDVAQGPVGTMARLGGGGADLQVVVDTPRAVVTIVRLFLGLAAV